MSDLALLGAGVIALLLFLVVGGALLEWLGVEDRMDARRRNGR